jgi:EmrB/QacA subfamily drug resistance transporter
VAEGAGRTGRTFIAALLAASLMPLNSTMIAVALPDIAREFDRPPGSVTQAVVASYLVAAIVLQSPGGKLGDRLGHWRVFAVGGVLIAAGAVLGLLAPALAALAVARILMAAGGALLVPTTVALIRVELPERRRGRAFGTFGAIMSLAAGVGPVLGGELVAVLGWRSIFLVNLPVLAVSAVLAVTARRPRAPVGESGRQPFDVVGSVLLTAALSAFVLGLEADRTGRTLALVGACVALAVPFVWWERRAADPVVAFRLFSDRAFTGGALLVALLNLTLYALLFELPQVLSALLALDAAATGRLLVAMMAAMVVTSPLAGRAVDRVGCRAIAVAGSVVGLGAVGLLAALPYAAPIDPRLPVALALLGVGIGLATPAAQNATLGAVSREQSGTAAGMSSTMRYLGGVVGVGLLGRLLGQDEGRAAVLGEHRLMLAVFAAALLAGLVCALVLPRRPDTPRGRPADAAAPAAARADTGHQP